MVKQLIEQESKLVFSVDETGKILGDLCDKTIYRLIRRGYLKTLPGLRHKMITAESIRAYVALSEKEVL